MEHLRDGLDRAPIQEAACDDQIMSPDPFCLLNFLESFKHDDARWRKAVSCYKEDLSLLEGSYL